MANALTALRTPLARTDLGRLIASARRGAGLTQVALASAIGTAQSVVSRWERGADTPRVDTLVRILRACGYEPDLVLRPADDGVDRAQIRAALAMTPKQRLASSTNVSRMRARSGPTATDQPPAAGEPGGGG
jgi:transcriptional regulator with XRE-family HTH domain